MYGKPVLHSSSSTPPSPLPFVATGISAFPLLQGVEDTLDGGEQADEHECFQYAEPPAAPPPSVENIPRPLSPTKLTPMVHSPLRYQSDAELELLRRKLANAPRPLKKRSSITEPEGPGGPNIQKLLYQRFNTLAGGMEGGGAEAVGGGAGSGTPFYQPANPAGNLAADTDNGNLLAEMPPPPPGTEEVGLEAPPSSADPNHNQPPPPDALADAEAPEEEEEEDDDNNNNHLGVTDRVDLPSPLVEEGGAKAGGGGNQLLVRKTFDWLIHSLIDLPECQFLVDDESVSYSIISSSFT